MRRLAIALVLVAAAGSLSAMYITEHQAVVQGALEKLGFEAEPPPRGLVGAPPRLKVTAKTIEQLQKLLADKKVIEIQGTGELAIQ